MRVGTFSLLTTLAATYFEFQRRCRRSILEAILATVTKRCHAGAQNLFSVNAGDLTLSLFHARKSPTIGASLPVFLAGVTLKGQSTKLGA